MNCGRCNIQLTFGVLIYMRETVTVMVGEACLIPRNSYKSVCENGFNAPPPNTVSIICAFFDFWLRGLIHILVHYVSQDTTKFN